MSRRWPQIEREIFEVEEQLVSKKIAERLPVSLAAKSATLAALERLEKARKELDEAAEPAGQRHRLAVSDPGQNRSQEKKEAPVRPTEYFIIFL